jgi:DNA (cytosine-5)-methyltransferase 1
MNELALFAGAGGGLLGSKLLGWRTKCAVEIDSYARKCLLSRQRDGMLERFPIWDNIETFDGRPWQGTIDIVTGGFPCQDISISGKGKGITGERSGLWKQFARVIGEVKPRYAFIENSPMLVKKGLEVVLEDLAQLGYDAKWGVIGASDAGFLHKRKRIWILANSIGFRSQDERTEQQTEMSSRKDEGIDGNNQCFRPEMLIEPQLDRMAYGIPRRVDRLKCIGNAQVPAVVKFAFQILNK